ncbi:hypothetical protein BP6252_13154 [Coleophoma cylindrospora]|uniref:Transcription factor domain-containing protein n=1 Tax=Coleophoma cylindrospora TaxID=1849047 RepID=A0A3D8QAN7_9HELO|nr:hypothetical protein BP6252_13154 [Coleophoma cylindrospora]
MPIRTQGIGSSSGNSESAEVDIPDIVDKKTITLMLEEGHRGSHSLLAEPEVEAHYKLAFLRRGWAVYNSRLFVCAEDSSSGWEERQQLSESDVGDKTRYAACGNCHQRKIRCDVGCLIRPYPSTALSSDEGKSRKYGFPCSNCISAQRLDCRVHVKKKRLAGPRRAGGIPAPIVRTSDDATNLPSFEPASTGATHYRHIPSAGAYSSADNHIPPHEDPAYEDQDSISSAGESASLDFARDNKAPGVERQLVEFIDQENLGKRSIQRGVRIIYVGKDVSNLNFLVRQRDGGDNDAVHHFPSDELGKRHLAYEPERTPREAFVLPHRALADELVHAYFKHVNPICPLVDEEIFLRQYRSRDTSDAPSLLVLQAILMVGAHVSRKMPERETLKATFFRRAKLLFDARLEKNRDLVVQAALLLTWHSDGAEDICANAWHWIGIAVRTASGLGMHRDTTPSTLNAHDKRIWRRIWWIMVKFDVIISLVYGRPQAINLDECDVQPLDISDFEGCGSRAQAEYTIQYVELCVIISKIVRERFGLRISPEKRKIALSNADEALANWALNLPKHLQLKSSTTHLWFADLHLTYNNFLILLHRPNPRKGFNDHGPNDSDICSAAATTITNIFEDMRENNRITCVWFAGVITLFTAMIQVSVELRFSNPILAIAALRRMDSSLLSLRELSEYWVHAEPILRLFEESSHAKHGMRSTRQQDSSNSGLHDATEVAQNVLGPHSRDQTDLDVLAAAANVAEKPGGQDGNNDQLPLDWRYFQDGIPGQAMPNLGDVMTLENEWREIYWQEPGIARFLEVDFRDK